MNDLFKRNSDDKTASFAARTLLDCFTRMNNITPERLAILNKFLDNFPMDGIPNLTFHLDRKELDKSIVRFEVRINN